MCKYKFKFYSLAIFKKKSKFYMKITEMTVCGHFLVPLRAPNDTPCVTPDAMLSCRVQTICQHEIPGIE